MPGMEDANMSTDKPKSRNDIGRWIVLALICAGGSTGGAVLRPHNPGITTEAWVKMQVDMEAVRKDVGILGEELRALIRRMNGH